MTLLIAATISVVLWFIPFAEFLTYPFRIFVTFIHEGGHALAALLTGNSVASLSVAMNASGETYTTQGGLISQIAISSAGYIGSMVTDHGHRRLGHARAVLTALLDEFEARGIGKVSLHATEYGEPLYRSVGFGDPPNPELVRSR